MARIYPLFSSSDGNCTYIGNGRHGIMIDAGVSCKKICDSLDANRLDPDGIHGIFITHTHSDHVKGLRVFLKKYNIPVYASAKNIEILREGELVPEDARLFEMTDEYVRHIQMPKQFKKAQALGWITAFVGAMSAKPTMVGIGLTSSANSTMTTELKNVAALKIRRGRNTIHVNQKLDKNQVYAQNADFDFVESFLKQHCINAKISY